MNDRISASPSDRTGGNTGREIIERVFRGFTSQSWSYHDEDSDTVHFFRVDRWETDGFGGFGLMEIVKDQQRPTRPQDTGSTPSPAVGGLLARLLASLAARLLARKAVTAGAGIVFGHGARHLAGTGLSQRAVEAAIRTNLQQALANATSVSGNFWGRVAVNGTIIEYRAFTLADGTIKVGTYYVRR